MGGVADENRNIRTFGDMARRLLEVEARSHHDGTTSVVVSFENARYTISFSHPVPKILIEKMYYEDDHDAGVRRLVMKKIFRER